MNRVTAADVELLLQQEAARTGDPRYAVRRATLRQWVRRGHITRGTGGYDLHEIVAYLDHRLNTGQTPTPPPDKP